MARDYLELGPVPSDETSQQVGTPEYSPSIARFECDLYRRVLRKQFGDEPREARLGIKSFPHDFGSYYEVVCYFDDSDETSMDYAFKLESEAPAEWPDWARQELEQYKAEKESDGRSEEATASKKQAKDWKVKIDVSKLWPEDEEAMEDQSQFDKFTFELAQSLEDQGASVENALGEDARYLYDGFIELIRGAEDSEEFDQVWEDLYDWADMSRVWINTMKRSGKVAVAERKPKMMPGQEPYTEEELNKLYKTIDEGAESDPGESREPKKKVKDVGDHEYRGRKSRVAQEDDEQLNLMDEMEAEDPGPRWMDLEGRPVRKRKRLHTPDVDESELGLLDEKAKEVSTEAKKVTDEAGEYISKKIKKLTAEGYPQKQAIAIVYSMARARGFKVPEKKKK